MAVGATISLWLLCVFIFWGCTAYALSTVND
jgi:hypothetical protein